MQIFFLIILIISLAGMLYFVWKKIPVLAELPLRQRKTRQSFKKIIKDKNPFNNLSSEKILHRSLSSARILILRSERKTSYWLQNLRKKSKKKEKDNYWEELKK